MWGEKDWMIFKREKLNKNITHTSVFVLQNKSKINDFQVNTSETGFLWLLGHTNQIFICKLKVRCPIELHRLLDILPVLNLSWVKWKAGTCLKLYKSPVSVSKHRFSTKINRRPDYHLFFSKRHASKDWVLFTPHKNLTNNV